MIKLYVTTYLLKEAILIGNMEIAINDFSSDNLLSILKEIATNNSRIKIINNYILITIIIFHNKF